MPGLSALASMALTGITGTYWRKVLFHRPIAYWPLWEEGGVTARCLVNPAQNGAYAGVTLGQPGIGDGNTCPFFDGANDYVNAYSVTFRDVFDASEGSFLIWARAVNLAMWTDGQLRRPLYFAVDVDNRVYIQNLGAGPNNLNIVYEANNVTEARAYTELDTDWICWITTWSKTADEVRYYRNGVWQETDTTLDNWAGLLQPTTTVIGAGSTVPVNPWHGWLAHCALFDRALTQPQITDLATV